MKLLQFIRFQKKIMQFSLRTIRHYHKLVKSKRAMNQSFTNDIQNSNQIQNENQQKVFYVPQTKELKTYQDSHLFKTNLISTQNTDRILNKESISKQKLQNQFNDNFYRNRDIKRFTNMSYKFQRTQKSQKNQKAIEDLRKIGQISINKYDHEEKATVRFNKDPTNNVEDQPFKRWRTLSKQISRNGSKSPNKIRLSPKKRVRGTSKKASMSVRIRKTVINNSKNNDCTLNLSTVQSEKCSYDNLKIARRKSSITPWDIDEQRFN